MKLGQTTKSFYNFSTEASIFFTHSFIWSITVELWNLSHTRDNSHPQRKAQSSLLSRTNSRMTVHSLYPHCKVRSNPLKTRASPRTNQNFAVKTFTLAVSDASPPKATTLYLLVIFPTYRLRPSNDTMEEVLAVGSLQSASVIRDVTEKKKKLLNNSLLWRGSSLSKVSPKLKSTLPDLHRIKTVYRPTGGGGRTRHCCTYIHVCAHSCTRRGSSLPLQLEKQKKTNNCSLQYDYELAIGISTFICSRVCKVWKTYPYGRVMGVGAQLSKAPKLVLAGGRRTRWLAGSKARDRYNCACDAQCNKSHPRITRELACTSLFFGNFPS